MGQEFYRELAQQARDLAERADPFTRQRLLKLAGSYDVKGEIWGGRHGRRSVRCRFRVPRRPPRSFQVRARRDEVRCRPPVR